jgi:RNA polymerase sigma factor (sigma-70 family)
VISEQEFSLIWQKHNAALRRFFFFLGVRTEEADDCGQRTWLLAWEKRGDFEGRAGADFVTWVFAIGRNVYRDMVRARHSMMREGSVSMEALNVHDAAAVSNRPAHGIHPAVAIEAHEMFARVTDPQMRKLFRLRYVWGHEQTDVATAWGVNESSLKVRGFREIKRLRLIAARKPFAIGNKNA